MTTAEAVKTSDSVGKFKIDVDDMLSKYEYFSKHVLPTMREGVDYYVINSKKSLSKAGSERLCSLYQLTATFENDRETSELFKSTPGLVCFICTLRRPDGSIAGQGRGSYLASKCNGDINKCLKMAEKSSAICATLRAVGISSFFSQDVEAMSAADIQTYGEDKPDNSPSEESNDWSGIPDCNNSSVQTKNTDNHLSSITPKQKTFLTSLAYEHMNNEKDREEFLASLDGMTREDASDSIGSFISK